jgi:hypothetical protein
MTRPMLLGVCDPGKKQHVYQDAAMRAAIERLGFDFLMHHIYGPPRVEDVEAVAHWAEGSGCGFFMNQENTDRPAGAAEPDGPYRRPGFFFQPPAEWVEACAASPRFMGVCYDEAEHWISNGVWVTAAHRGQQNIDERGRVRPHFFDADGCTLQQAYEGNLHNLRALRAACYGPLKLDGRSPDGGRSRPIICTEQVFPVLGSLFARAGISPFPKYLKESVTPAFAAMALGAARQYGTVYGACLDLWAGSDPGWPGHGAARLRSALLYAYWSGCDLAYVENLNFQNRTLYEADGAGSLTFTPWGDVVRWFVHAYVPAHPRPAVIRAAAYRPAIVIVRFPDSDWGQSPRAGYISGTLYGAANLLPDERTRYWLKIWHVITRGAIPVTGLTWHAEGYRSLPFRFHIPTDSVAVYDHRADDPALYEGTRLAFLSGVCAEASVLETLNARVRRGLVVATPLHLAPAELCARRGSTGEPFVEHRVGDGAWIVTDDVLHASVRARLEPLLGDPAAMTLRYAGATVCFGVPDDHGMMPIDVR